ncbi:hypothetical protein VitviT2T_021838 [Vitis vinifera]|uniref:Pectinesterase inhibitor domain-containing protein n=1 Tax=Vitis vinifera TaxID=29760 RepID=A0ABY9D9J3_VITVI|nr:cell wall / vacuolar inhibitor of fructosidase 1 [Vitis vinifera]WKA03749.1 hypothetical protein VitviT2T_021838 [Vitis vinifera]|eukprot:XP_010660396.1 PREDICTED: cell wall / vacuolar inhibitor of fructosidase 1-like [Vitis vinifera]
MTYMYSTWGHLFQSPTKKMNTSGAGVAIALVIMLSFLPLNQSQANLVEQTCQKVQYHDLCVSALRSDGRSSSADVKGLAAIMLQLVKANGTDILAEVNTMLPNATDDVTKKCLGLCRDKFGEALNGLIPEAMAKLQSGSKHEAMLVTIEVGESAIECDSCFSNGRFGPSRGPPPFSDKNHVYFYLATVAKDIIGLS